MVFRLFAFAKQDVVTVEYLGAYRVEEEENLVLLALERTIKRYAKKKDTKDKFGIEMGVTTTRKVISRKIIPKEIESRRTLKYLIKLLKQEASEQIINNHIIESERCI